MKKVTKDVSMHQLMYLLFFSSIVHKVVIIPSRIVKITCRDLWVAIAFFVALDIFHLIMYYIIIKINPELTLYQIIEKTLGKVAAKIVSGFLALYLLIRVSAMLIDYNLFAADVLYPISWKPVALPIIIVSVFCVYRGLRSIMRILELIGTGVAIGIIGTMIIVAISSDFTNILPILESGLKIPLNGFADYLFFSGDYFCILCILGRIKVEKGIGINMTIPAVVSSLLSIMFAMAYYGFYEDIAVFQKQGHALSDIALFLLGTQSLARFDIIFSVMWMIAILIRILINTWVFYNYFRSVFGFKDTVAQKYILSIIVILALFAVYNFINNNTLLFEKMITSDYKYYILVPLHLVLPIMAPILAYIATKKEKRRQKHNQLFTKPAKE
ncbi:MAG TPA: GerAB/ArcD/ProY family transporter [Clostridiales bacterium]|nr:GerAB/ArcD/ProY family transporter [Clostridiales bacterium]